jgi:DnaJ-class molecular chaperone
MTAFSSTETCGTCSGSGTTRMTSIRTASGQTATISCGTCGGSGTVTWEVK